MANYCYTKYVVEGDREALTRLKDAINEGYLANRNDQKDRLCMIDVLERLGYSGKNIPEDLGVAGEWMNAVVEERNGAHILMFLEEYKWKCSCNMETLAKMEPFAGKITGVYRSSVEPLCELYETTDDKGKYFPEQFALYYDTDDN